MIRLYSKQSIFIINDQTLFQININLNYQRNLDQTNNTAETNQIDNTERSIKTNDVEQIAQSDNIEIILNVKIKP